MGGARVEGEVPHSLQDLGFYAEGVGKHHEDRGSDVTGHGASPAAALRTD